MRQQDPYNEDRVLPNSVPGINVMTRDVKVTPGSQLDAVASLNLKCKHWNFELGYNFWFRDSESVKLKNAWSDPGTFGLLAVASAYQAESTNPYATAHNVDLEWVNRTPPTAARSIARNLKINEDLPQLYRGELAATGISSDRTISTNTAANGTFIEESDVDMNGHPSAVSHKIYGGLTYGFDFKDQPMFVGLGGSYEFPQNNAALEQWAIWAKLGVVL